MPGLLNSVASLLIGAAAGYATFYLRGALARREQIAKSLADFYSSAAVVYYAAKDREKSQRQSEEYALLDERFDKHYKEFLSSSTFLASLVPPKLEEQVLEIEDLWDEINDDGFQAVPEKKWFDRLDALRYQLLDAIAYSRLFDPFWKLQNWKRKSSRS
jgi:hypothetical protein